MLKIGDGVMVISDVGHDVFTMATGYQLLQKIDFFAPDVVILDIKINE